MRSSGEQRAVVRRQRFRDALLAIPRLRNIHSCGVRDLNERGAGLRLGNLPLLPTQFNISLDGFHTTLACRLIWRDGAFAGVEFQRAARKQT
jgi:hypothetical protein